MIKTMKFRIKVIGEAILEIDESVIKTVDQDWRDNWYPYDTPEEIAEHIGYNMLVNNFTLSQIDGFADLFDSSVTLSNIDWETSVEED